MKTKPSVVTPLVPVNRTAATITSDGASYATIVLLAMVGMAIVCFGAAAVPATQVRWRPAAYVVATHHIDFAIAGLALLLLAGLTFVASGGG